MKTEQLIDAIGSIDDGLLQSAQETRGTVKAADIQTEKRPKLPGKKKKWLKAAAVLIVVALAASVFPGGQGYTIFYDLIKSEDGLIYYHSHKKGIFQRVFFKGTYAYDKESGSRTKLQRSGLLLDTTEGPMLLAQSFFFTKDRLYRINGTELELAGEIDARGNSSTYEVIDIIGDDAYCLYQNKSIYRENIKTGEKTDIIDSEVPYISESLAVYGSRLFYRTGSGIDMLDMNTGEIITVFEASGEYADVFNGQTGQKLFGKYYIITGENCIIAIDCETLAFKKLSEHGCLTSRSIDFYKGKIYYNDRGSLRSVDPDTGEIVLYYAEINGTELIVVDGGFFYSIGGPIGLGIYFFDLATKKITQID